VQCGIFLMGQVSPKPTAALLHRYVGYPDRLGPLLGFIGYEFAFILGSASASSGSRSAGAEGGCASAGITFGSGTDGTEVHLRALVRVSPLPIVFQRAGRHGDG